MLRVKLPLLYMVLVVVLVGMTVAIVHSQVGALQEDATESSLRQTALAAEQDTRLDQGALLAKTEFVARDDRLYRSLKGEFVQEEKPEEGEEKGEGADAEDPEGQRHLDAHEKLTAQKYRLDELAKGAADQRNVARSLLARAPHDLDIFMALDAEGVGVAALGKDLYSWFGMDVADQFESVSEVAEGGVPRIEYWRWAYKPAEEKRLYQVALAPVRPSLGDEPSGVVVLGTRINDGLASKKKTLASGRPNADEDEIEGLPEVAFYEGTSIVGSTFSTDQQKAVATALGGEGVLEVDPDQVAAISVGGTPYLASSRALTTTTPPIGIVVLANVEEAKSPLNALRVDILLIGVVMLLVGAGGFVFMIVRHMTPLEELEDGMQEVIAGNKDYVWSPQAGHELQKSLAQSLNLMSAYLQGKPMPDDEAAGQSWGDLLGGGDLEPEGPGQVQGVDLAALSAPPPGEEEAGEPEKTGEEPE